MKLNHVSIAGIITVLGLCTLQGVHAQSLNNELRNTLTDSTCARACFLEITPGITLPTEVEDILDANSITYNSLVLDGFNPENPDRYSYTITSPTDVKRLFPYPISSISILIQRGSIENINFFDVKDLPIKTIFQSFGSPTNIYREPQGYVASYEGLGLRFFIDPDDPDIKVNKIELVSEEVESFLNSDRYQSEDLQPCTEPNVLCNVELATPLPNPTLTPVADCTLTPTAHGNAFTTAIDDANTNDVADTICITNGTDALTASNIIDNEGNSLLLITGDNKIVGQGDNLVIECDSAAIKYLQCDRLRLTHPRKCQPERW